jgi:hypothetical protein
MAESNNCPECRVNYGWHLIGCTLAVECAATPPASSESLSDEQTWLDDAKEEVRDFLASGLAIDCALTEGKVTEAAITRVLHAALAPTKRSDATDAERMKNALRMVLDIAQRRLLLPSEATYVEALLTETDPRILGYTDEEVAALNREQDAAAPP